MGQKTEQAGSMPETLLISRILAGETQLFEHIVRKYNQRLFRIGMSVLHNDMETEDAMQSTYIKAYEHLKDFENRSALGTWITRIMLNECLAQQKKQQRLVEDIQKPAIDTMTTITPDYILANKELNGILEQAIEKLPEKYRLVFVLREVEEFSVKETGDILQIEEANVKVRLNRAKTMLREHLNHYMKDHVYTFHLSRCDKMVERVMSRIR